MPTLVVGVLCVPACVRPRRIRTETSAISIDPVSAAAYSAIMSTTGPRPAVARSCVVVLTPPVCARAFAPAGRGDLGAAEVKCCEDVTDL